MKNDRLTNFVSVFCKSFKLNNAGFIKLSLINALRNAFLAHNLLSIQLYTFPTEFSYHTLPLVRIYEGKKINKLLPDLFVLFSFLFFLFYNRVRRLILRRPYRRNILNKMLWIYLYLL